MKATKHQQRQQQQQQKARIRKNGKTRTQHSQMDCFSSHRLSDDLQTKLSYKRLRFARSPIRSNTYRHASMNSLYACITPNSIPNFGINTWRFFCCQFLSSYPLFSQPNVDFFLLLFFFLSRFDQILMSLVKQSIKAHCSSHINRWSLSQTRDGAQKKSRSITKSSNISVKVWDGEVKKRI